MDSLPALPRESFQPVPFLCLETDTLTLHLENAPSFAHRVDNFLTIFQSFENNEVVGFQLKGIARKMKDIGAMICLFEAKTVKVQVRLILLAYFAEADDRGPYEGLLDKTEGLDAPVDLQV